MVFIIVQPSCYWTSSPSLSTHLPNHHIIFHSAFLSHHTSKASYSYLCHPRFPCPFRRDVFQHDTLITRLRHHISNASIFFLSAFLIVQVSAPCSTIGNITAFTSFTFVASLMSLSFILNEWFAVNKLSLNLSKTNFMLFTNSRRDQNISISINNCEIDMVYKTKFLGVMTDSKFNWKDHVAMVKSKLSKSIAIMRKAKHLLDRRSGMILYFSLFLPYLSYCCAVWGNTYSSNIKNVYILQKKAVRIVCNVDYQHPSNVTYFFYRTACFKIT